MPHNFMEIGCACCYTLKMQADSDVQGAREEEEA